MKQRIIHSSILAMSATVLMMAAAACNPNRNNPNYNAATSQGGTSGSTASSQPGTAQTGQPGSAGGTKSGSTAGTGSR